jgi:hypothetical protein
MEQKCEYLQATLSHVGLRQKSCTRLVGASECFRLLSIPMKLSIGMLPFHALDSLERISKDIHIVSDPGKNYATRVFAIVPKMRAIATLSRNENHLIGSNSMCSALVWLLTYSVNGRKSRFFCFLGAVLFYFVFGSRGALLFCFLLPGSTFVIFVLSPLQASFFLFSVPWEHFVLFCFLLAGGIFGVLP